MADSEFVGSHEKAFPGKGKTGAGQNGDPRASSTMPHARTRNRDKRRPEVQPPIPAVSLKMVDATLIAARGGDVQDTLAHRLKNGANVKSHAAMLARTVDNGSPGGAIPKSLDYKK